MKPSAAITARLIVEHGIRCCVLSPGSRNAPLLLALQQQPGLRLIDVVDERAAAFLALGIARQSRCPVALVCTSGTAVLNYAAAAAEAFYQGIPLILLSADRPMQWIDQDDSQTIRQYEALANVVKGSFDIPDFRNDDDEMIWYASRTVNEALLLCSTRKAGPVHINLQYNAPLTTGTGFKPSAHHVELIEGNNELSQATAKKLAERLRDKRVLLIAGYMHPSDKLTRILTHFLTLPNVALLPEILANLHLPPHGGIDKVLTGMSDDERHSLLPDVVITLGGALLSRMVKEWLRSAPSSMEHWALDQADNLADCFRHLSLKITTDKVQFFSMVGRYLSKMSSTGLYAAQWRTAMAKATSSTKSFMLSMPWCDLYVHHYIFKRIPKDWNIFCSNGTAVRYAELFADPTQQQMLCNRGTSGIEGCTATAVGTSLMFSGKTLLITGDMSLRHDLGGLSLACIPDRFKIIVMRNGGGDIFRFINATSNVPGREVHFTCADICNGSLEPLAKAFGFQYIYANNPQLLKLTLDSLMHSTSKALLEIDTSMADNAAILKKFFQRSNHQTSSL